MIAWLPLALTLLASPTTPPPSYKVKVIVLLCDGDKLACGAGGLGDPQSVKANLYWGALYGADRFLSRSEEYALHYRIDGATVTRPALMEVEYDRRMARGERGVTVTLRAYDGREPRRALEDFLRDASDQRWDLVVWIGHDVLMDFTHDATPASTGRNVAVLACDSEKYFEPVLQKIGARSLALTASFMAPEGYLLDALLRTVARHGPTDRVRAREALVAAYAKYQRITPKAAGTVFTELP